jgi:hypothetical protein
MVYDSTTREILMFGGADDARVRDDLWAWNGARHSWRLLTASGPGPRTFPGLAFDRRRGEVVVFGGNRVLFGKPGEIATLLADTWVWRDGWWSRRDLMGPSARAEAAMAYDSARGRVVLFGGYERSTDGNVRLGDTWEWDGRRWSLVATSGPAARSGAAMAYDDRRRRMVLFGGRTPPALSGETWEWDGSAWARVADGGAEPRFNPVMAFDTLAGEVVRFGGWTGHERTADTSIFRAPRWHQLAIAGPSPRNHAAMAYDAGRRRVVLFGGHDGDNVFGDVWEWDGSRWTLADDVPSRPRVENDH